MSELSSTSEEMVRGVKELCDRKTLEERALAIAPVVAHTISRTGATLPNAVDLAEGLILEIVDVLEQRQSWRCPICEKENPGEKTACEFDGCAYERSV